MTGKQHRMENKKMRKATICATRLEQLETNMAVKKTSDTGKVCKRMISRSNNSSNRERERGGAISAASSEDSHGSSRQPASSSSSSSPLYPPISHPLLFAFSLSLSLSHFIAPIPSTRVATEFTQSHTHTVEREEARIALSSR